MTHIRKITHGYVVQTYDTDLQCCIRQEFIAGDLVEYEDAQGNIIEPEDGITTAFVMQTYQPYHMVQPD